MIRLRVAAVWGGLFSLALTSAALPFGASALLFGGAIATLVYWTFACYAFTGKAWLMETGSLWTLLSGSLGLAACLTALAFPHSLVVFFPFLYLPPAFLIAWVLQERRHGSNWSTS